MLRNDNIRVRRVGQLNPHTLLIKEYNVSTALEIIWKYILCINHNFWNNIHKTAMYRKWRVCAEREFKFHYFILVFFLL